jgi:murein hydrolase activator
VNRFFLVILLFSWTLGYTQKNTDRLKQEQKRLEQQIATTKSLFEASKQEVELSLQEVRLIDQQVRYREMLLTNIDNQIKASSLKIELNKQRIHQLNEDIEKMKRQYAELLLYAYKMRSKYGRLLFIFSAESVEEALKRKIYLEKLAEIQQKQLAVIEQNMSLLDAENQSLAEELKNQQALAEIKRKERQEIIEAKKEKEEIYRKLKAREQEILAELRAQEIQNQQLQAQIQEQIRKEIAAEQARLEAARRAAEAAEAKRKAEEAKRKAEGVASVPEPKKETPIVFAETKEAELAGNTFALNKGRLPWPVEKGTVTSGYGKNPHPTLPNVFTQNNGIDISTPKNAVVRAVFDGEVTSVLNIPGAGKAVIVKHGNYRTVYSNLQDVYVQTGSKVNTKTVLGALLPSKDGKISVAHFEIHEVKDGQVNQLNPTLWITK